MEPPLLPTPNVRAAAGSSGDDTAHPAARDAKRRFAPRRLQTRILALFVLLITAVQLGGFLAVNTIGTGSARRSIGNDLVAAELLFHRLLAQETARLVQGARLLSADYGFREAIATGDKATIASVLANHGKRIEAGVMMLVDLDEQVVADTLGVATGERFFFPRLLGEARAGRAGAAMVVISGRLYQLVIVPVLAPLPIAWVAVGFPVDDALASDFHTLMRLDVSFVSRMAGGDWRLHGSTLPADVRTRLVDDLRVARYAWSDAEGNAVEADERGTRIVRLPAQTDDMVAAVLQQPVAVALEPFRRLQRVLALVLAVAVVVSIVASVLIARGIARPVGALADAARRIAGGDYSAHPPRSTTQEIGALASAFRTMQQNLASRESRILDLAYRDTLTGLPNRARFLDSLELALAERIASRAPLAVLVMDLDHFKEVNDTLGHTVGDLLLQEVGARLAGALRGHPAVVARLGGDEFAILLRDASPAMAKAVAQGVQDVLKAPMRLDGHAVDTQASIGIALHPDHGAARATLLRRADTAMYAAKRTGVGLAVWDERHEQGSRERLSLMNDLRKAIDAGELALVYQPKAPLASNRACSVEALLRWQHPTRGAVPPAEFIPFAERTGCIRAITEWVLDEAVRQCAAWQSAGLSIVVSVNLSARDLNDKALPERFAERLRRHGVAASSIGIEITESAIFDDARVAIENLEALRAMGITIAIDDFGTGYSSLAYLRRLPVDALKIDRAFVAAMTEDAGSEAIVRWTIDLAHDIGLTVVAEGVESETALVRLRALGCDEAQGYFVSPPRPAAEIPGWIRHAGWARPDGVPALRRVVG